LFGVFGRHEPIKPEPARIETPNPSNVDSVHGPQSRGAAFGVSTA
jgi:hypothetical protein